MFARLGTAASPSVANAKVLVIGCGRVGGYLAMMLAQHAVGSGKGRITCYDKDRVEAVNLPRSPFLETSDVGHNKAVALQGQIRRRVPSCRVDAIAGDFMRLSAPARANLVRRYDLVIAAADVRSVQVAINRAIGTARRRGAPDLAAVWPGIWVGAGARGSAGEVVWTDARPGPCYECVTGFRGSGGRPAAHPGTGADLLPLIHIALKVVLQLLDSRPETRHLTSDRSRNVVLVHGASLPGGGAGSVLDPMSMRLVRTARRAGCAGCGVAGGASGAAKARRGHARPANTGSTRKQPTKATGAGAGRSSLARSVARALIRRWR